MIEFNLLLLDLDDPVEIIKLTTEAGNVNTKNEHETNNNKIVKRVLFEFDEDVDL
jgi:hypothetical protein